VLLDWNNMKKTKNNHITQQHGSCRAAVIKHGVVSH